MRFTSLALGLMAASGVIAGPPNVPTARVQLANDQSGANADVDIPTDGRLHSVQALWGGTSVSTNGVVSATSAQLVGFQQTTRCTIVEQPNVNAQLNAQATWTQLEGGQLVKLDRAWIWCKD
ncbi:hypothetical protein BDV26DRAFT_295077 [Aspergillus bertholletiae]|uniref:Uncharacterized protein n=1 Tax=Aspergillus bertholletiae TaxID=1226010 RepID=A0A5N7B2R8_9EURO|nr:hypothetical protein BDV26DRAFT_295077 [Aspergillus bertholletiae]